MLNLGVLVSGNGTNLQTILDRIADGYLAGCRVAVVISSRPKAYALERARAAGVPRLCVRKKAYENPDGFDAALVSALQEHGVDLVVTAGYTTVFGQSVIDAFQNRIINVHPALIPSFCGKGFYGLATHEKALEYGVKLTGATTHIVWLETDSGPVIMQKAVAVEEGDTPERLQKRVMTEAEQLILPETIRLFIEGRVSVEGRRTRIAPPSPQL